MSTFRFAIPGWSHAMWLVVAWIALLLWLDWRRCDTLSRLLSTTMQTRLMQRSSRPRRWLCIGLLGLSAAALVVALMRPQWGLSYRKTPRVGAQIMVCLDVSKSMLAEDTAPNRLERAKAELTDLLPYLDGDQVGLIAFAGRATVLCPLTPDFGFFKLILDAAGPHSVGRGGTRLEEPIRKALRGFRTEADVARVILLITDGEDLDSHPRDAAKAAAERGIKILTIGFGDEAGSQIHFTDPDSGARSVIRDANGVPVVSRLDGETLRQIALATEGAYIPAGTGTLDLQSIYTAHIAALVRGKQDDRGHAVRREGFQWAVLCGLLFLLGAVLLGSGSVTTAEPTATLAAAAAQQPVAGIAALGIALALATPGQAQLDPHQGGPTPPTAAGSGSLEPAKATATDRHRGAQPDPSIPVDQDPRNTYNDALAHLQSDLDRATKLLTAARRSAGTDGAVRFRATYNLGWVEVQLANARLSEQPQEALEHLRLAADWFRDAVRLRPDSDAARHNLEVTLRRILELTDALAKQDARDLTQRLDAVIAAQRNLVATARPVVQRVAATHDPNAVDQMRGDFRQLDAEQRKILGDSQTLARTAREELDALRSKDAAKKSPQDNVRAVQLDAVQHDMNRADQRMGQARSQMRRRQAQRAFRRAATALDELKRARDRLRQPVEVLDVILADAVTLAQTTSLKAVASGPPVATAGHLPEAPAWLTRDYLADRQLNVTQRTTELEAQLQAGLDQEAQRPAGPPTAQEQQEDTSTQQFLARLREAMPLLAKGKTAFEAAGQALAAEAFGQASQEQLDAIAALRSARERFLQIRGLVELAYARETQIEALLPPRKPDGPESSTELRNQLQIAGALQAENLDRSQRLAALIRQRRAALSPPPEGSDKPPTKPEAQQTATEQAAAERQQFELADQFLNLARKEMVAAAESLAKTTAAAKSGQSPSDVPEGRPVVDAGAVETSRQHVTRAVEQLQELRRLFFSIVDHLRETAQRQTQLNDATEHVAALESPDSVQDVGPLAHRQQQLQKITGEIAKALDTQAHQQPPASGTSAKVTPQQLQQLQQARAQLTQAAKLVTEGGDDMTSAYQALAAAKPTLDLARTHQDAALEKLAEALALLQPPQQKQQPQNQKQQDQKQEQEQNKGQEKGQQRKPQTGTDPARLLQAIRDREAQRRRDRQRRGRMQQEPVEKDW